MDRSQAVIGMKVVFHWNPPPHLPPTPMYMWIENKVGRIIECYGDSAVVRFTPSLRQDGFDYSDQMCAVFYLYPTFSTPEEEAEWKEKASQAEEKRLDQQRREQFAAKYL